MKITITDFKKYGEIKQTCYIQMKQVIYFASPVAGIILLKSFFLRLKILLFPVYKSKFRMKD